MAQQEIINRNQNPGIYVDEQDQSASTLTSVTRYDGVIHMVIGFSKTGPQNDAVLMQNPQDFLSVFGPIDQKLERKESYFHRTALKMLETGPTYCMSTLLTDPTIDFLNWQTLSSASNYVNEPSRTNAYPLFFDRTGFWQRDTDDVLNVAHAYAMDPLKKLLTFVNYGGQDLTIWVFKSTLSGFDVNCETWYGANDVPEYLNNKEYVSDFMVRVIMVKGNWTNYADLAVDPKWSQYFNVRGLFKSKVDAFLTDAKVNKIGDYNVSLIPDFQDSQNRNMFIETILNQDTNTTGIFAAFDRDQFITEYRNGLVDLIGYNLITRNSFSLDFLSYKEQITDELLIDETFIDQAGNSWGDPGWVSENRAAKNADGFVNDTQLKPLIISQTSTFVVKPFVFGSNSYAIIKGTKVKLTDSSYTLELDHIVKPGYKFILVLVMTIDGVSYRLSPTVEMTGTQPFPPIDASNEYVIGYYEIVQDYLGEYITTLHGVSITEDGVNNNSPDGLYGWIPFFSNTIDVNPKIRFEPVSTTYQIKMRFEKALSPIPGDYYQNRIYYLWSQLSKNLIERQSLVLDANGFKKLIDTVEPGVENSDRTMLITLQDRNSVAMLPPYTYPDEGWISIYYNDLEFLYQTANYIVTDESPYSIPENGGRLGPESVLFKAYYGGLVSTGDRVFIEIADETNVQFINDGQNLIVFNDPVVGNYQQKIFVNGTSYNDGIYNILGSTYFNGNYSLIVEEAVVVEFVPLARFFDASLERYFKFYFIGKDLYVQYEEKSLNQDDMLRNIQNQNTGVKYKRTLQIASQLDQYTVLVDYTTYAGKIATGHYLQADVDMTLDLLQPNLIQRGLTRVLEVYPYDAAQTLLLVRCDSAIQTFQIYNTSVVTSGTNANVTPQLVTQTNWFLAINDWVTTYKGFFMKGYQISNNSLPDGTEDKLASILQVIAPGTGLHSVLSNVNKLPYRYLIDTFGLGFNPATKTPLASICNLHNSLGFFNMPSIKAFKKYTGLNFLTSDGRFDLSKLIAGGDKNDDDGTYFTVISDETSVSLSYYFPYIETLDLSTKRPILIPPAMYAADAYMRNKWQVKTSNIYPWSIVAGYLFGRVNDISAVESEFNDDDLGLLNQMHVNAIAKGRDDRFFLYSENTSYPLKSGLTSVHVREALISFEQDMRDLLLSFQWRFNTPAVRETIVKQANILLGNYIAQNAFYDGRNVMDDTNNSPDLIDAGIGVLDTYLEPVQGLGVILLNLTVLRTGQVASQFFFR